MPQILETPYGEIEFGDDVSPEQMQEQYQKNLPAFQEVHPQEDNAPPSITLPQLSSEGTPAGIPSSLGEIIKSGWEGFTRPVINVPSSIPETAMKYLPTPALALHLIPRGEEIRKGIAEGASEYVYNPMTSGLGVASLGAGPVVGTAPRVLGPAMKIGFGVMGAQVLPQAAEEAAVGVMTGDPRMAAKGLVGAGAAVPMIAHGVKGISEPFVKPVTERTQNAPTERPIQEGVLSERPGTEAQRQAIETSTGNRLQPSTEIKAAQDQVALTPSEKAMKPPEVIPKMDMPPEELAAHTQTAQKLIDNVRQGGTDIKIEEAPGREYASDVMWTSPDGVVHVNVPRLETWIKEIGGKNLDKWMDSGLTHEVIHSNVFKFMEDPGKAMADYFSNATKAEQLLAERAYYRKFGSGKIDPFQLGAEMFRRDMERLDGLKPTELVQSKGLEWIKQGFIDLLERGIKKTRETLGTKASKAQLDILNRYQERIDSVRKAKGWEAPTQPTRMQPAEEVAKIKEEEKPRFTPSDVDKMTPQQFMDSMKEIPDGLTGEAYRLGQNTKTPEALQELSSLRDKYSASSKAAMKVQDFDTAMSNSSRTQFYREAYEAATGTGSAGNWLRKNNPNYKPPMEAEALRMEPKKKEVKPESFPPPNAPLKNAPVAAGSPSMEVVRANKDFNIFNNVNSPQWTFMFGRLGEASKSAIERIFTGEFKMRESIGKDVRVYVEDLMTNLPKQMRKEGGKAFYEVLDGKTMDQINKEWANKKGGEQVIAQAEKLKGRLEEIRTTIRDTKKGSYQAYLEGLNQELLSDLYNKNTGKDQSNLTKAQMADELSAVEYPADWGISDGSYLPHLFFGNYKVTASLPGQEGSAFVTRAKTISEAKAKIYELTKANPDYANANFTVAQDTVIPADMIRLGDRNFWRMVNKMKDKLNVSASEVKEAQQGIIGRKASKQKWFGSLQERKGFAGYSKDFRQVMTSYLSGFHRWKELSSMQRDVQPLIEQVRREGRTNAALALDDIMESLWGKPARSTVEFDAFVRQTPGLRDTIKPLALERWSRNIRSLAALLTLKTVRFATINRLQPLQGLYPMVGEGILARAKLLQHSKEGKALLDEGGVTFDVAQYGPEGSIATKARRIGERFSGERSNQELAFLAMYLHGSRLGLPKPEAIKYAKLRGQLMTQFTPLVSDIPPAFRGPFGQLAFQYKRFPIKQAELFANLVRDRNVPGIVRMLAIFGLLGGASFYMRQTLQSKEKQLKLKRTLRDSLGDKGADLAMQGLPGLLNADLSGSLVLGDEPMGENIYEKLGRQTVGPAASLLYETTKGITTEARQPTTATEKTKAILRRIPSLRPLAEASDLITGNVDVMSPDGEVKYRRALTDAIAGLGAFRTVNEADRQTAVSAIIELRKEQQQLQNALYVALKSGQDTDPQWEAIRNFNQRWPEVAMTTEEIQRYVNGREKGAAKTDIERATGRKFAPLMPARP